VTADEVNALQVTGSQKGQALDDARGPIQQYFGNYKLEVRDAALLELEESLRQAGNQSQLYGQLANVMLASATIAGSLLASGQGSMLTRIPQNGRVLVVASGTVLLGFLLMFFAEVQKTITLNARKVVTLRRVLGLDYSRLHLTLPSWRIEGATNPFAIRLFPGWRSATAFPFWVTCAVVLSSYYFFLGDVRAGWLPGGTVSSLASGAAACLLLALLFRHRLLDVHETIRLRASYIVASIVGLRLLPDFGYVLFRAELAVAEMHRLGFHTSMIERTLVALEDNRFFNHHGVDFRAAGRAALSRLRGIGTGNASRSGASTLTMQLARTLLVADYSKRARRKVLEVLLAGWLERQYTKEELLTLYLASVRFAGALSGFRLLRGTSSV